ncbi:MAG: hypothetical protein EBS05_11555 [Proteobacteria bacterium]|nr:hypothetical protein [Pseudomonadota bacterium]
MIDPDWPCLTIKIPMPRELAAHIADEDLMSSSIEVDLDAKTIEYKDGNDSPDLLRPMETLDDRAVMACLMWAARYRLAAEGETSDSSNPAMELF